MSRPAFRRIALTAAVALATVVIAAQPSAASAHDDYDEPSVVLRSTLVGSTPAPAGPTLFGRTPGTAPWVLDKGRVRVDTAGNFDLRVRGLVIPTPPANGTNPVPTLSASLVCNGAVVATTATVPFDTAGNARINTTVAVPSPCLAPAVLVHPNAVTSVYIAASGS